MTWLKRVFIAALLPCLGFVGAASDQAETGSLTIVGSDTLSRLMTEWTEAFYTRYPSISVEVQAVGSAAAPPALQHGTANIGSMSRPMNADERSGFVATRGYPPTEIAIASDTVVLITHPSNPMDSISYDKVARVFGMPGTCGTSGRVSRWSELSPMHTFGHQKIQVFGRSATSGTYQYFRRAALCDGDPGVFTNEIPGSSGVVNTVARLPTGLAYAPQAQVDKGVKTLNIIARDGRILSPSAPDYPFKRVLYLYTVTSLANAKDSTECRFIEFIAGPTGLASLRAAGFEQPIKAEGSLTLAEAADVCR